MQHDNQEKSKVDEAVYQEQFHDPCVKCEDLSKTFAANLHVCTFCQHLRLGHLFRCILPNLPRREHLKAASICIRPDDYQQAQTLNCELCKMLSGVLDSIVQPGSEVSISRSSVDSNVYEGLYLQILEANTIQKQIRVSRTETQIFQPYDHLGQQVDWHRIRRWKIRRTDEYPSLPLEFRVIDVLKNCLVEPRPPFRYVALSYIWGGPSEGEYQGAEVQATLDKVTSWENEASLPTSDLPATIQDATTCCRKLRFRYLWVDRLCIPQDSRELKHEQINRMDEIYASSQLTIVAAAGQDARHGLVGVNWRRFYRHETIHWEGLELLAPFPAIQDILSKSKWNTRGWTFQEGICAPNVLYFTEYGVFGDIGMYDMHRQILKPCIYSEKICYKPRGPTFRSWDYFDCVKDYTKRSLTHSTDILNAFAGITHHLEPIIGQHCEYGLPLEMFDEAILWQPLNGYEKPRTLTTTGTYPSWSWCSIQGAINYQLGLQKLRIYCSVASWAFPSTTDSLNIDLLTAVPFVPFMKDTPLGYCSNEITQSSSAISNVWENGFFIDKFFTRGPIHGHDKIILERSNRSKTSIQFEKLYGPQRNWVQHVRHSKTTQPLFLEAFSADDRRKAGEQEGRVLAFGQTTWLELEYIEKLNSGHALLIRSSEGLLSGTIWLTQHITESHVSAAMSGSPQCMEFLALSITLGTNTIAETAQQLNLLVRARHDEMLDIQTKPCVHGEERQGWTPTTEVSFVRPNPPRVNVMLITRNDGVAQRLGIGQIYMDRWKEANPQFCTTVLE